MIPPGRGEGSPDLVVAKALPSRALLPQQLPCVNWPRSIPMKDCMNEELCY